VKWTLKEQVNLYTSFGIVKKVIDLKGVA